MTTPVERLKAAAAEVRARHEANQAAERAVRRQVTPLSYEGGQLLSLIDALPPTAVLVPRETLERVREALEKMWSGTHAEDVDRRRAALAELEGVLGQAAKPGAPERP